MQQRMQDFVRNETFNRSMLFDDTTKHKISCQVLCSYPQYKHILLYYSTKECLRVLLNGLKGFSSLTGLKITNKHLE